MLLAGVYTNDYSLVTLGLIIMMISIIVTKWINSRGKDGSGWLYFIGGGTGPIKIGITKGDPVERCRDLQTGNPVRLRVLFSMRVSDPQEAEGVAHNALEEYHVGGEWYARDAALELLGELRARQTVVPFHKRGAGA